MKRQRKSGQQLQRKRPRTTKSVAFATCEEVYAFGTREVYYVVHEGEAFWNYSKLYSQSSVLF